MFFDFHQCPITKNEFTKINISDVYMTKLFFQIFCHKSSESYQKIKRLLFHKNEADEKCIYHFFKALLVINFEPYSITLKKITFSQSFFEQLWKLYPKNLNKFFLLFFMTLIANIHLSHNLCLSKIAKSFDVL